jgi:hypothetical protein
MDLYGKKIRRWSSWAASVINFGKKRAGYTTNKRAQAKARKQRRKRMRQGKGQ